MMDVRMQHWIAAILIAWVLIQCSQAAVELQISGTIVERTAKPGDSIQVLISITNRGDEPAKSLKLFPMGSSALIPYRTSYDLGDLNPNSEIQLVIPLKISQQAREGQHLLELKAMYSTEQQVALAQSYYLAINVTRWVYVDIVNLSFQPQPVQPGQNFSLIITIKNQGDYSARNIRVQLAFEVVQQQEIQPAQPFSPTQLYRPQLEIVKVPFIPLTDYIGFIPELKPDQEAQLEFKLSSDRSTKEGDYPIPVLISYQDEWGIEQQQIKNVAGISLKGIPELEISELMTDPERISAQQPFMLSVVLENMGTGEARGILAELYLDQELIARDYLGSLKQEDTGSAVFDLISPKHGTYHYLLVLSYMDISGNKYTISKPVILRIHPEPEIHLGIGAGIGIGLACLGILVWRIKSRK